MANSVGPARLVAGLAMILSVGSAPAAETVTLREQFKDGRVRYVDIKTTTEKNTVVSFFPDPFGSVDERNWWIVATEGKEPKPGLTAVTWRVDRLQARHRDMMGRERKPDEAFDSLRPNASRLAAGLGPWADRSVLFWLNERGDVDQMIDPPAGKPPLPLTPAGQSEAPTATDFRSFAEVFYGFCVPGKPVSVGDKWTRAFSVKREPYGTIEGTIEFVLRGVETRDGRRVARVEFSAPLKLVPTTQPARPGADEKHYDVKTATYEGWSEFDVDAGMPLAAEAREELKFDLIMTAAAPAKPNKATSQASSQPASQPVAKPVSYTFQQAESHRTQITVGSTPFVKPIVVNAPPPASAPAGIRPIQPNRPTTQPHAPIGVTPRPIPSRPLATTRPGGAN